MSRQRVSLGVPPGMISTSFPAHVPPSATPPYRLARKAHAPLQSRDDMRGRWAVFPAMRHHRTGTVGRHYSRHDWPDKALLQSQMGFLRALRLVSPQYPDEAGYILLR